MPGAGASHTSQGHSARRVTEGTTRRQLSQAEATEWHDRPSRAEAATKAHLAKAGVAKPRGYRAPDPRAPRRLGRRTNLMGRRVWQENFARVCGSWRRRAGRVRRCLRWGPCLGRVRPRIRRQRCATVARQTQIESQRRAKQNRGRSLASTSSRSSTASPTPPV